MGRVELDQVTVSRDGRRLLDGIDLVVADRERLSIVGPSGAGKTTLLRCVAGVEPIDHGRIRLDGRDVTDAPPRDRDIAMMDQRGSLQPHLDVGHNLGFPLRLRKVPREEVERRVAAEARAFSLSDLLARHPGTLAAGEQHQVALARTLIRRGSILLLDEPLAQIDAGRRNLLIRELVQVQEGYGVTLLLATNDQRVGMAVGRRLAVLHDGRLVQTGTPTDVHERPATEFVAGFVGSPPMNLLPGHVVRARAGVEVRAGPVCIPSWSPAVSSLAGQRVTVGVRPEALSLAGPDSRFTADGVVTHEEFLGHRVAVTVGRRPDERLQLLVERPAPALGDEIRVAVDPAGIHLFEPGGAALAHSV